MFVIINVVLTSIVLCKLPGTPVNKEMYTLVDDKCIKQFPDTDSTGYKQCNDIGKQL